MIQNSRTFRIFISSTFSDLKEERNALQEKVFPRLRGLCDQYGARFQAIDLRWGVSEEASIDQQTMNICLGEIARCQQVTPRPNFILLLGDRYGWRPPPPQIPASEYEAILSVITESHDLAIIQEWYKRDDNANPAQYCLLPRQGEMAIYEHWELVESKLQGVLEKGAKILDLPPERMINYAASATEQEIVAGAVSIPDAREHVFCFIRETEGLPKDIKGKGYIDLNADDQQDEVSATRLIELKDRLENTLSENVHRYQAKWLDDEVSLDHLEQLCNDVYKCLSEVILDELSTLEDIDTLLAEIEAHRIFGQDRARIFIGREDLLGRIMESLKENGSQPLAIWGESGSGKSALMAKVVQLAEVRYPEAEIVYRFIGATPESSNGRSLLESLCQQISRAYGADEDSIPHDYEDLAHEFPKRLMLSRPEKPLVIILDALDQLSSIDTARSLAWLPADLPANVHLVATTLPGEPLNALESKLPVKNILKVRAMDEDVGGKILRLWLSDIKRKLQPEQEQAILNQFRENGLPLYLKLAFEEARRWKSYDPIPELEPDVFGMIRMMFKRLSNENNHGKIFVEHSLRYLVAAKNGLSEGELIDIMSDDKTVIDDFLRRSPKSPKVDRLPVVVWSRLYFDIEPYLRERIADGTTLLDFYHRQLIEVIREEIYDEDKKLYHHVALATYFDEQPLYKLRKGKRQPNLRKLSELPYQQTHGELWDAYHTSLLNLRFLEAKCDANLVRDLIDDYANAEEVCSSLPTEVPTWEEWKNFINLEAHNIERFYKRFPQLLFQQAYNSSKIGAVARSAQQLYNERKESRSDKIRYWFERVNRPMQPRRQLTKFVISGYDCPVNQVRVSKNGKWAISGAADGSMHVWNLQRGNMVWELEGHTNSVTCLDISEQDTVVSGSWDKTVRMWDIRSGNCISVFEGHQKRITSAIHYSEDSIVSADSSGEIWVWDAENRKFRTPLTGHSKTVNYLLALPNNRLASASDDNEIRIWDIVNGRCINTLKGHSNRVVHLTITPNGGLLSSSHDNAILLWDLESGRNIYRYIGHRAGVNGTEMVDQANFISWSFDGWIRVWSLESGECKDSFVGHEGPITMAFVFHSYLISASQDQTLRVWDRSSAKEVNILRGHGDWVNDLAHSEQGIVVSASKDKTLRIWDMHAAVIPGVENDPILVVSKADRTWIHDKRKGVICSGPRNDLQQFHLLDLNTGEVIETFDADGERAQRLLDDEKKIYGLVDRSMFYGSPPIKSKQSARERAQFTFLHEEEFKVSIRRFSEGKEENVVGLGGIPMLFYDDGMYYTDTNQELAFYPIQCKSSASVYDFDRTIAVDGSGEVHIIWLHCEEDQFKKQVENSGEGKEATSKFKKLFGRTKN